MIQTIGGIAGTALLFAIFTVLQRSRRTDKDGQFKVCVGCHCSDFCDRDGHRLD